ncbi:MAG TPA: hypothetical protein VIG25_18615 [Pyrinomonadaceae bacterium]
MSIQSLTPPQDITWTRMSFSRDMIDTNFADRVFSPKWRSSLAVYFYIVPEEETADAYPNSRIVYLKMTCSITGWNPSEALRDAKQTARESGTWDDLQSTLWEVITASGWASKYWPCLGAIMQVAVYPNDPEGVAPDDYPYIMDFEPKKRELFEAVTEGSESLSGTTDTTSLTKGSTSVKSTEYSGSAGFSVGPIGASASAKRTKSETTVTQNQTATSREARETLSRTTSSSQMYQLFNGYHLGSNRALFVVAPRPHTVSNPNQTEFNLIDGERKLEGIQEVFLVVHMPRSLDGFCIQAGLDTGHETTTITPFFTIRMKPKDNGDVPGDGQPPPPDPPPPPPDTPIKQLVITRRIIQSCGTFDENGNFNLRQVQEPVPKPPRDWVVGELAWPARATRALLRSAPADARNVRAEVANTLNMQQSLINRSILDLVSTVTYEPRAFVESDVFKSLVANAARTTDLPLTSLANKGYMNRRLSQLLVKNRVTTLGELMNNPQVGAEASEAVSSRTSIIDKLLRSVSRPER